MVNRHGDVARAGIQCAANEVIDEVGKADFKNTALQRRQRGCQLQHATDRDESRLSIELLAWDSDMRWTVYELLRKLH